MDRQLATYTHTSDVLLLLLSLSSPSFFSFSLSLFFFFFFFFFFLSLFFLYYKSQGFILLRSRIVLRRPGWWCWWGWLSVGTTEVLFGTLRAFLHMLVLRASAVLFSCWITSTETIRLIRDGEPRTSTSTFTQLLSFFFHGALGPQKPSGLLGTESPGRPPRLLHSSWAPLSWCFRSTETIRTIRPRTATSTFTQPPSSEALPASSVSLYVHRDAGTIWDGEPRTSTWIFAQFLSSEQGTSSFMLLYVHRNHKAY